MGRILLRVKNNWPVLLALLIAGLVYGVIGLPMANAYGHWWLSVVFYAALVVAAVYARCNPDPIHSKLFHRKVRRTPQSL
ncbi:hypothetical protein Acid345_1041 [Candidatus Koribacter versatilis Ellin345]|uniref:Uncharacterized protein n=1 Tax=Koribacter versatilis (strain Ellin345) TaxID=204669 RepID=Q1ISV6_KORVE|nr:hypothetical protein [Candidatus Koribacter versatilis]ABF40044.1 hypothetical protein Acid345_1041 [Candidatus Koribacter versatilis Ellin345]